ncbi:MAG: hypothetical protein ACJAZP_002636 [Psychromonas sp.]|jgi:hypothetical protein
MDALPFYSYSSDKKNVRKLPSRIGLVSLSKGVGRSYMSPLFVF